jgi:hypothetical protein
VLLVGVLIDAVLMTASVRADVVVGQTAAVTNNDARMRPVLVAVVNLVPEVSNPRFIRINDPNVGPVAGGFTMPAANTVFNPRPRAVRFSGANLPAAMTNTVDFDFDRPFGPPGPDSIPIRSKVTLTGFGPAPPPPPVIESGLGLVGDGGENSARFDYGSAELRSSSVGDDMFSKSVAGGATGASFLGVNIPANEYGYFYQFNATGRQSPDSFSIRTGGNSPTTLGIIADSWSYSDLSQDLGDAVELGIGPAAISVTDSMYQSELTGIPGVSPLSWTFGNGAMTASFSPGAFGSLAPSAILWFTSPTPPDLGGPLGIEGQNGVLSLQGAPLSSGGVISPVPEPGTAVLVFFAGSAIVLSQGRRTRG